jgi:hypothetical protein
LKANTQAIMVFVLAEMWERFFMESGYRHFMVRFRVLPLSDRDANLKYGAIQASHAFTL